MSVLEWSGALLPWRDDLDDLKERIGRLFGRPEPRRQIGLYLDGLIGEVDKENGGQLAEYAGDPAPGRMEALLGRTIWDQERARDICREYVIERLGDASGVLVVDETGFLKKGTHSVGVGRQYSGTAGRIENCQVGVFLGYASAKGHALIDRRLYLPKEWATDVERREAACIPDEVAFTLTIPLISNDAVDLGKKRLLEHELAELFHERPQSSLLHGWNELVVQATLSEQGMCPSLSG